MAVCGVQIATNWPRDHPCLKDFLAVPALLTPLCLRWPVGTGELCLEHPGPQGTGGPVTVCPTRMSGLPQTGRLLFAPLLEYCHKGWVWPWPWPLQKSKGRAREHLYLSSNPPRPAPPHPTQTAASTRQNSEYKPWKNLQYNLPLFFFFFFSFNVFHYSWCDVSYIVRLWCSFFPPNVAGAHAFKLCMFYRAHFCSFSAPRGCPRHWTGKECRCKPLKKQ